MNNKKLLLLVFGISLLSQMIFSQVLINRDPDSRKDYANLFYKTQYTLFDLLTDEPIFPDKNNIYHIYYATNKKKPKDFNGTADQLSRLQGYKFTGLRSCMRWCNGFKPKKSNNESDATDDVVLTEKADSNSNTLENNKSDLKLNISNDKNKNTYQDGKIISEVSYYENKRIGSETFYKDGIKIKSISYDNNGVVTNEDIYEDKYTTYNHYMDGVLRSSTRTSNATLKREGYEISYYSNGKLNYKEFFKDDVSITYEGYFENGQKQLIEDSKKTEKYNENGILFFYLDKTTKKGYKIYNSGEKWVGEMSEDGKTIGKGTYYYNSGNKYVGTNNSNENIADGLGEFYWQNGKKYIGNFKDGNINGYGKITNIDGSIQEGIFSNGDLVNDYNKKQITSSNPSDKSNKKKYTTPPLHLSTKELREWYDSEDGQIYLQQSGLLKAVQSEIFKQAASLTRGSGSTSLNNKNSGIKPCPYCNKEFSKPSLKNNPRCQTEYRKTTNPGYVICDTCHGYGYMITNLHCDCIDGIGWCYEKDCHVIGCDNGWYKCSHCNGSGQSR